MATGVSDAQLKQGTPDPKFRYIHTPLATSDDELVSMDLVTVAQAVHRFNLPRFYSLVKRVLRNPGGVIAMWGDNYRMSSSEDTAKRFLIGILELGTSSMATGTSPFRSRAWGWEAKGIQVFWTWWCRT
ncbi:Methyltransferase domain [Musa troglodytarum]|uniref:Methyltransferase domain n=1 Tax=Musa troglodytarum TaxID=320322 RepID=A0A9E7JYW4_9LILI|nr:Methyltransferase domain [Musa troglodytarum]